MNSKISENQKQYPAAKRAWEDRTGELAVAVRLGAESRARLLRLAERHGGRRQAVEAALIALETSDADHDQK